MVVLHYARHELKKGITDTDCVNLAVFFVGVDHYSHECIIYQFQVWVRSLANTSRRFDKSLFECFKIFRRKFARGGGQLCSLNVVCVKIDNSYMLGQLYHLVVDGFVQDRGLHTNEKREWRIDHIYHRYRQNRNQGMIPAERENERAQGNGCLRKQSLLLRHE